MKYRRYFGVLQLEDSRRATTPKLIVNRPLMIYSGMNHDTHFVVWILFSAAYAVYASGWASFSVSYDSSLLKPALGPADGLVAVAAKIAVSIFTP